jgi:hypothetical protein
MHIIRNISQSNQCKIFYIHEKYELYNIKEIVSSSITLTNVLLLHDNLFINNLVNKAFPVTRNTVCMRKHLHLFKYYTSTKILAGIFKICVKWECFSPKQNHKMTMQAQKHPKVNAFASVLSADHSLNNVHNFIILIHHI